MGGAPLIPTYFFTTRVATENDLDEITQVHLEGFTEEPQVHYCYPFRHKYPEDHWKWTRREYERYLEQPKKYLMYVLQAPVERSGGGVTLKVVGHALWNVSVLTEALGPDPGEDERRDADKVRLEAFQETASKRFTTTHFAKWGKGQVNLANLVVHPDFRRHGGATMLVNWGIATAEAKGWPVTVCASPMGQLLYTHLQFKQIATEVVQVEGERETLIMPVMIRGP